MRRMRSTPPSTTTTNAPEGISPSSLAMYGIATVQPSSMLAVSRVTFSLFRRAKRLIAGRRNAGGAEVWARASTSEIDRIRCTEPGWPTATSVSAAEPQDPTGDPHRPSPSLPRSKRACSTSPGT